MSRLNLTLLMLAVLGTACYKDDSSGPANRRPMAKVLLTDSPFPYDTVDRVDIYVVSISASTQSDTATSADSMSWVTITAPHRTFNLLDLQQGTTALVGEGELPADQYRAVRLVINTDSSAVIGVGGSPRLVHWNGPAIQAIHAFVENPVAVPEQGAEIVIDFDVGRSFHYNDLDDGYFNFFPWIRAVNKAFVRHSGRPSERSDRQRLGRKRRHMADLLNGTHRCGGSLPSRIPQCWHLHRPSGSSDNGRLSESWTESRFKRGGFTGTRNGPLSRARSTAVVSHAARI